MAKADRKPVPSSARTAWMGQDDCWFCKNPRNCGRCHVNRAYLKKFGEKKIKGRTARSQKPSKNDYIKFEEEINE